MLASAGCNAPLSSVTHRANAYPAHASCSNVFEGSKYMSCCTDGLDLLMVAGLDIGR